MALLVRAALPWSWRDRGQQRVVTGGLRAAAAPCSTWLRANSQNLASCREIVTLEEVRGLGFRVSNLRRRRRRRVVVGVARSSMNLGPSPGGGGGGEENGIGRVVVNLTIAGGLTYLTITGKLGWLFDAFVSLWLFVVLVPIVGFIAFLWFADREIISSTCPNCGNPFQVLEFTMKEEEEQFCPYCSQPFKLEGKQFVRDGPRFSKKQSKGFRPPFGGGSFGGSRQRQTSGPTSPSDSPGVIVDVEAEVLDQE